MPWAAPLACSHPGCRATNCAKHRRPTSSAKQGYGYDWKKLRERHLAAHPFCVDCGAREGLHVDHVLAHQGNERLRLDPNNLATRCRPCHSRKTATQDHGFGNGTR